MSRDDRSGRGRLGEWVCAAPVSRLRSAGAVLKSGVEFDRLTEDEAFLGHYEGEAVIVPCFRRSRHRDQYATGWRNYHDL